VSLSSLLLVLLSTVLASVVALASKPAWRPLVAATDLFEAAKGLALAFVLIVPTACVLSWLMGTLLQVWDVTYLRTVTFVAILLAIVPLAEAAMHEWSRYLPQKPGFALLTTANAAALGVALLADMRMDTVLGAAGFGLGAGVALALLLIAFAAMYERLTHLDIPLVFRGPPVALVTMGIMALGFMGFVGVLRD